MGPRQDRTSVGRHPTPPQHTPRLRLKPEAPHSGYVDGAWWPRSDDLTTVLPESRRQPLDQELTLLGAAINRSFDDEEDRRRACTPDFQGMGGSESRG